MKDEGTVWEIGAEDQEMFFLSAEGERKLAFEKPIDKNTTELMLPYGAELVRKEHLFLASDLQDYDTTAQLLEETQAFIHKWVDISERFEKTSAVYSLATSVHDVLPVMPYLRVIADWGTGKSRFLETMSLVTWRGFLGMGQSPPSIFRLLDALPLTLTIDEASLVRREWKVDFDQILATGFKKSGAVMRTELTPGGYIPKLFKTYSPKIIASRQRFDDPAIESRCLDETMMETTRTDIAIELPPKAYEESQLIRNKLQTWRFRNRDKVNFEYFNRLEGSPRLSQLLMPLRAVAEDGWKAEVMEMRKGWEETIKGAESENFRLMVMDALLQLIRGGTRRPTVKEVTLRVCENQDFMKDGNHDFKTFSPKRCGGVLGNLGIPKSHLHGVVIVNVPDAQLSSLQSRWGWILSEDVEQAKQAKVGDYERPLTKIDAMADLLKRKGPIDAMEIARELEFSHDEVQKVLEHLETNNKAKCEHPLEERGEMSLWRWTG